MVSGIWQSALDSLLKKDAELVELLEMVEVSRRQRENCLSHPSVSPWRLVELELERYSVALLSIVFNAISF